MNSQLDPKTITEQLCQFARANLVASGVEFDEHSPLDEAGIDSFGLVELLLHCERAFGARLPESHLTRKNLASVATLAQCIVELVGSSPSSPLAPK